MNSGYTALFGNKIILILCLTLFLVSCASTVETTPVPQENLSQVLSAQADDAFLGLTGSFAPGIEVENATYVLAMKNSNNNDVVKLKTSLSNLKSKSNQFQKHPFVFRIRPGKYLILETYVELPDHFENGKKVLQRKLTLELPALLPEIEFPSGAFVHLPEFQFNGILQNPKRHQQKTLSSWNLVARDVDPQTWSGLEELTLKRKRFFFRATGSGSSNLRTLQRVEGSFGFIDGRNQEGETNKPLTTPTQVQKPGIAKSQTQELALTKAEVESVIQANQGSLSKCRKQISNKNSSPNGVSFSVNFAISPDGTVSAAELSSDEKLGNEFEACVVQEVKTWNFPKPRGNTLVQVKYPFTFKQKNGARSSQ